MNYDLGLTYLRQRLPAAALEEFLTLEARLRDNLDGERKYGGTDTTRAARAEIVRGLNRLALAQVGMSFNDLCLGMAPPGAPAGLPPASAGEHAARGLRPLFPQEPAPAAAPIRNRWALLVGVDDYTDPAFPNLKYCTADVQALADTLSALGYTVVNLNDKAGKKWLLPTRDNVEAELARLCKAAGPDDLLLVYIACHGKLVEGQPVLVLQDTRAPTLDERALRVAQVERRMRGSQARRLVLLLDACHTGVEIGRDLADPAFIKNVYDLAQGYALIAASSSQQVAQEWAEKQHGVFTYYLLEALSGQAAREGRQFVTVDDVKTYVLDRLRRWNVAHGGLVQEPTARLDGLGDIILADFRRQAG